MSRITIAFTFTFILTVITIAPAVLTLVEKNSDVSLFFDLGEEEEGKNGKESKKDLEIKVFQAQSNDIFFLKETRKQTLSVYNKTYNSVYKQVFSPPPQYIFYKIG